MIKGWDEGIQGIKVGGKRKLVLPSELAYGRSGAGRVIPPDATLIFETEIISVNGIKNISSRNKIKDNNMNSDEIIGQLINDSDGINLVDSVNSNQIFSVTVIVFELEK
jgi:hypothetical protein